MTVMLQMPPELEARVRDAAAKQGLPPDALILNALARAFPDAQTTGPQLTGREAELLEKINLGLSDSEWKRYWTLREGFEGRTLTPAEHSELQSVTDRIERATAERMKFLIELAALRHVPVPQLMGELGLGNGKEARGGPIDE